MILKTKTCRPVFVEFGCQDTKRNLPRGKAAEQPEARFLRLFERFYLTEAGRAVVAGREFGMEGFGRADLVWLAWESKSATEEFTALALKKRIRLTAIEGKVSDWRKGLQQAFRYRYFAHRSVLVLPMDVTKAAVPFLATFRRLRVGLWGFDCETAKLRKWCTPRSAAPLNRKAWEKALHLIESRLQLSQ